MSDLLRIVVLVYLGWVVPGVVIYHVGWHRGMKDAQRCTQEDEAPHE